VLVEDITNRSDSEREEDNAETAKAGTSAIQQTLKAQYTMDITLPYLLDEVVTGDDMLEKVPKLRYSDHYVRDVTKFPDLAEETYFENIGEIGPLGKPIMDPAQWITGLYNSEIMNFLDITHFRGSKNVGLYVK
jgi:hypothetical protein